MYELAITFKGLSEEGIVGISKIKVTTQIPI
jgi:hypothetical protein